MLPGVTATPPNTKVFRELDDYDRLRRLTPEEVIHEVQHDRRLYDDRYTLHLVLFRKGVLTGEEFLEALDASGRFEFVG